MIGHSSSQLVTYSFLTILLAPHLLVMAIALQSGVSAGGTVLDMTLNLRITGASTTNIIVSKLGKCVLMCLQDTQCLSVSYNTVTCLCYLNNVNLNSPGVVMAYDTSYISIATTKDITNWHMVFRGTEDMGASLFDSWNNQGHDDIDAITSASIGCLSVDGRLPCDRHFRSRRLDNWNNIEKVKFELYTDAQPVFHVTFNATGSKNKNDVFNINNIIDSSVPELIGYKGAYNYASVVGEATCSRRFYMNFFFNTCNGDRGWLMISDKGARRHCCLYDDAAHYPKFIYTKKTTSAIWSQSGDVGYAQVFAVFIKYY